MGGGGFINHSKFLFSDLFRFTFAHILTSGCFFNCFHPNQLTDCTNVVANIFFYKF